MNRLRDLPIPTSILMIAGALLLSGAAVLVAWRVTGELAWVTTFFRYPGNLFLVASCLAELTMAIVIFRQFSPEEPLGAAWGLMGLSAACRLAGTVTAHVLAPNSTGLWHTATVARLRQAGLVIGGPLQMVLLAFALGIVLRAYRRLEAPPRLTWSDYFLLVLVFAYTLVAVRDVVRVLADSRPVDWLAALTWPSDPLLSVLLVEAVLLRRAALQMRGGLVASCWAAYAAAVFFTSLGDFGMWATAYGYLPWPASSLTWYIWLFASAAYALGPAYMLSALQRAWRPLSPAVA